MISPRSIYYFFFKKDDLLSERSDKRYLNAARTAVYAIIARGVNIATGLITIPLTLSYMGKESFGLWMTLSSFVAFLVFTDFGIGIGLQNALSECDGQEDMEKPKFLISSAMFAMVMLCCIFIVFSVVFLPQIPLHRYIIIENIKTQQELLPTIQAMLIVFGIGLPFGLIQRIYNGYQKGYLANIYLAAGRILSLFGVLLCVKLKLSLPILAITILGVPYVVLLLSSFFFFKKHIELRPKLSKVTTESFKKICSIGITAVGAQIGAQLMICAPAFVISNKIGVAAVGPYAITQKLIGIGSMLLYMVVLPLWPAYSEAAARGDFQWVRKTFYRSLWIGMVVALPIFLIMTLLGRPIISLWAGNVEIVPDWPLLIACNLWGLLMAWNIISATLLNGLNHMMGQATYGVILPLLSIALSSFVADQFGVAGIIWIGVVTIELFRSAFIGIEVYFVLKRKKKWTK